MSNSKRENFSKFFDDCDKSGNGELTINELADGLKNICQVNKTQAEIVEMFMGVDSDGNKTVTKEEFLNEMLKMPKKEAIRCHLKLYFKEKDTDNSGYLDTNEVREMLMTEADDDMPQEQVDAAIAQADTNGDGKVSLEELVRVLSDE